MSKKKEIMTIVLIITVALVGIIGTTLAVFSTGSSQIGLNSFKSGCLNITIEDESEAIKLSKSYPITDLEGVESSPYTFTIKNNCSTPTSYQINLESINETTNTLNSDYVRISLSSDTMDNLISTLSSNTVISPSIDNAYAAYNLYTGSLEGNSSKTYELKEWIEYNATIEQAANKVYESRISVVANPDLDFSTNYEVKTTLAGNELQGILSVTEFLKDKNKLYKNIINIVNDETYPFNYDEATKKFTSTNKVDDTVSSITFSVGSNIEQAGMCYTVSSEESYDEAIFYLDDEEIGIASGEKTNCINIGDITPSNQIKVEYSKDSSAASGNDEISFYLIENAYAYISADSTVQYCGTTNNICTPNTNVSVSNKTVNINVSTAIPVPTKTISTALGNLEVNANGKVMVCSQIGNGKTYCSNPIEKKGCSDTFIKTATTDEGICETEDDWGTSYYYRGAVDDNWVQFAGFYWRIIRINGDGSIRMIYNGPTTDQTGETTQIGTKAYNLSRDDNAYVGFMYGTAGSTTYAATHANINTSTILGTITDTTTLLGWYKANIVDKGYSEEVSNEAGFCNDRTVVPMDTYTGNGIVKTLTSYGPRTRNNTFQPTLKCSQITNDMFTTSGSSKGNKKLQYPVGLIILDEVIYAGGRTGNPNNKYYLYTNQTYWTLSPFRFNGSDADAIYVSHGGGISYSGDRVSTAYDVRPVINLASNVKLTGSGTASDPYKVLE